MIRLIVASSILASCGASQPPSDQRPSAAPSTASTSASPPALEPATAATAAPSPLDDEPPEAPSFEAEARDEEWASATEAKIRAAFEGAARRGAPSIEWLECRTERCRLRLLYPTIVDGRRDSPSRWFTRELRYCGGAVGPVVPLETGQANRTLQVRCGGASAIWRIDG